PESREDREAASDVEQFVLRRASTLRSAESVAVSGRARSARTSAREHATRRDAAAAVAIDDRRQESEARHSVRIPAGGGSCARTSVVRVIDRSHSTHAARVGEGCGMTVREPSRDAIVEIAGERVTLLAERAAYWQRTRTLLVADTHFGKAATFRAAGIPV